jgi:hypothetical protein
MGEGLAVGEPSTKVLSQPDPGDVLDALVSVEIRHNQPERSAMLEREWLAVEAIGEDDVLLEQVRQQDAGAIPIERGELDETVVRFGTHPRDDESLVDVLERIPAPAQATARPARHAMKIGDELFALQLAEVLGS